MTLALHKFGQSIQVVLMGLLLIALAPSISYSADKVAVRAAEHPTYGRLVLDWGRSQTFEADIREGSLIVTFPEAFEANLSGAERALSDFLSKGEIYNNNKSIRFKLKGNYTLKSAIYGTAIAIDLLKDPASVQALSIAVRVGDHPKYSRLVVDWPTPTGYQVQEGDDGITVQFDKTANLNLSKVKADMPKFLTAVQSRDTNKGTELLIKPASEISVKAFRSGNSTAFDFFPDQSKSSTQVESKPSTLGKAKEPTIPVQKLTNNTVGVTEPALDKGVVEQKPKAVAQRPAAKSPIKEIPQPKEIAPDQATPRSLIPASTPTEPAANQVALPSEKLLVDVGNLRDGFRLIFPWKQSAAMTLFERSGNYWLVFDKAVSLDFRNLSGPYKFLVLRKTQFAHPTATVARLAVREGYAPSVTRVDNEWRIDFRLGESSVIQNTIDIQPQPATQDGARIFIPAVNNGDKVSFRDPQAGDKLIAVPLHTPSWGFGRPRTFTQFTILPSMQGIALTPRDQTVEVAVERNGVSITAEGGLQLTRAISKDDLFANGDLTDQLGATKDKAQLVRLDSWRQVPFKNFVEHKQKLQQRAARSPKAGRNAARMELAKFFVGHKYFADAVAVLGRIQLDDPRADEDGVYRLLRGLSNLGMRHLEEAEVDLFNPVFNGVAEVAPWRAKLAAEKKDWKRVTSELKIGEDAYGVYDQDQVNEFNLLEAEAALEDYDIELANKTLEDIRTAVGGDIDLETAALREYMEGVSALRSGDVGRAITKFDQTIALDHRPTTAKAKFAKTNAMLAQNEITTEEAIEELKTMSFAWRGDDLELNILKRIGDLQIASGDMREGLKTFKEIVMTFPKAPIARDIAREMNDIFNQLFLEGGAAKLPPIKALALYYEYRELTPLGDKGDQMIRNLADRLIKVDLLEQAAQLLDHQVNFRLKGAQKSLTGSKLAVVHLWNGNPKESLDILNKTRWRALPDKVKDERRYIQARAFLEMDRYEDALDLLEEDKSKTAQLMRADIYWKSKNWKKVIGSLGTVLQENGADKAAALSEMDRQRVMQMTVARSLAGDQQGLQEMRDKYRTKIVNTPDLDAFDLITDNSDGSDTAFRERSTAIAKIGQLESFMAGYREQLKSGEFWSAN